MVWESGTNANALVLCRLVLGWDGMGWDGMGWDGMGWDGMSRREIAQGGVGRLSFSEAERQREKEVKREPDKQSQQQHQQGQQDGLLLSADAKSRLISRYSKLQPVVFVIFGIFRLGLFSSGV